ncbi:hypothetical protein [Chromobacterium phragmitis]|uniref:Uncharacterized protein n=1 Tax=Chromobacterium phragmitis TaxID=2202141 RepID=A0ABV0IT99_9NEIS|nr:hypothetical protein [Chromobacterium phragmitis]
MIHEVDPDHAMLRQGSKRRIAHAFEGLPATACMPTPGDNSGGVGVAIS